MDDVKVEAARSEVRTKSRAERAKVNARTRTALLTEKERQRDLKAKQRAKRAKAARQRLATVGQRAIVVGPIVAPMSVAWTGQSGFAMGVLGWSFLASILYAAAYELSTVFTANMYHEAKKDGDKGWEYRLATWAFVIGGGVQQWWHYSDNWHATPRSVTYSTMSAVGLVLWELYARLIHRRKLRADGKLPEPRPAIGLARWLRYPRISYTAWSGAVRYGFSDSQDMWGWAETQREIEQAKKTKKADLKKQLKEARAELAALQKAKSDHVIQGEIERASTSDPEPTSTPRAELEAGPVPTQKSAPELEAGPTSAEVGPEEDQDEAEFRPTSAEVQAIKLMMEQGLRLNRENVAEFIRENRDDLGQPEGIGTKRAAEVAKWGRANTDELKAVG